MEQNIFKFLIFVILVTGFSKSVLSQGDFCNESSPLCAPHTIPAGVNSGTAEAGPYYDCLGTQPNPGWYYIEIDNGGNMHITLTNSADVDVDFVLWGPYGDPTSPCSGQLGTSNVVDCSYSTDATEYIDISAATSGQNYMLMVNNYSNTTTDISLVQTGGAATTNCDIVLPIKSLELNAELQGSEGLVEWTTEDESNTDYFSLEKSHNGYDWVSIHSTPAGNNTEGFSKYSFIDPDLEAINWYRVVLYDNDGSSNYSNVTEIYYEIDENKVNLYPSNFVNGGQLNLDFVSDFKGEIEINLWNVAGATIMKRKIPVEEGKNEFEFTPRYMSPGVYFFGINSAKGSETIKIVVR